MDPIAEEQDLAFTNLVYTEVGSTNTGLQYENVEGGSGHKYENVGQEATKYENVDNASRYENVPNTDPARPCYQNVDITSENQNDNMSEENQNLYENVGTDDTKSEINTCEHYENYERSLEQEGVSGTPSLITHVLSYCRQEKKATFPNRVL